ncbi:STAS domain-containing protein [Nonomuraea sp. NPDC050328]|uniref:STAS domain-containing protein n=1 Tax=Nonomuraea sp. NPDC050328 TaxID=3364361 RepID=UPI0037A41A78
MTTLTTDVHTEAGDVLLHLAGELDSTTAPLFRAVFLQAVASRPRHIEVDMRSLTFCDSAGLQALLATRDAAAAAGVGFHLAHVQGALQRVLSVTGLDAAFSVLTREDPVGRN